MDLRHVCWPPDMFWYPEGARAGGGRSEIRGTLEANAGKPPPACGALTVTPTLRVGSYSDRMSKSPSASAALADWVSCWCCP